MANFDFEYSKKLSGASSTGWIEIPDDFDELEFTIKIPSAGESYFETTADKKSDIELDDPVGTVESVLAEKWAKGNVTASTRDTYFGAISAFRLVNVSGESIFTVRGNK